MKKYLKLSLLTVLLSGCGLFNQRKAIELNDTIVTVNNALETKGKSWGELLGTAIETKNYAVLKPERIKMVAYVDSARNAISHMEDVGGSEAFRKHELDYLSFERDLANENFGRFEQFNEQTTMEEVKVAWAALTEAGKGEKSLLIKLKSLQLAYAEKNNFKLDPNKK